MEEILKKEMNGAGAVKILEKTAPVESDSLKNSEMCSIVASAEQATVEVGSFDWSANLTLC